MKVLSASFMIAVVFFFCLVIQVHAESGWTIEMVGVAARQSVSLALDSNDDPHIAYTYYTNGDYRSSTNVTYASWSGSGWDTQTLDSNYISISVSLALDSFNHPHISYIYSTPESSYVKYTSWTGSNWNNQTVDTSLDSSFGIDSSALALDSNNNPHITYIAENELNNTLIYASWTGSNWSTHIIDSNKSSSFYEASIRLDSNNHPHIIYGESTNTGEHDESGGLIYLDNVKHAEWNGQSWNVQTVFLNVTSFGNVALDSNGYPHFTYSVEPSLEYASWDGSNWHSQFVDSNNLVFDDDRGLAFLALDSRDKPHISYWRAPEIGSGDSGSLMYAYWTGSNWHIETVDNNGTNRGAGPIVLDSSGNPHLSYPSDHLGETHYYEIKYASHIESPTQEPFSTLLVIVFIVAVLFVFAVFIFYFKKRKH
jgi:hypothetical protein